MERQQSNRDALITLTLGAMVSAIAIASAINLLCPLPVFSSSLVHSVVDGLQTNVSQLDR